MIQQETRMRREEKILSRLDDLNFATQRQLQIIEGLGGDRNAHRILYRMEKDKLLTAVRYEKKVYYLSARGKERIGSNQKRLQRNKIRHTLMRNDLYIKLGMPDSWKNEVPVTFNDETIIPDAMYKDNGILTFVEIDNVQTMRTNIEKIKKYEKLSEIVFNKYRHHPVLVWYSRSEIRKTRLKHHCEKHEVKYRIY